jgi:rubrerythrin
MGETKTEKNLYEAFVGEAKATMRLKGYAERADKDGYPQIAKLFRAISAAEEVHALKHLRLLKIIRTTEENLEASFLSETTISENVYPEFLRVADEEGNKAARMSFSHARDAEEIHGKLYKSAMSNMLADKDTGYYVCEICGYVAEGEAPDTCPVCNAPKSKFRAIE